MTSIIVVFIKNNLERILRYVQVYSQLDITLVHPEAEPGARHFTALKN